MRVRKLSTFAVLAVAASLSLTACNDDDVTGGSQPSSVSSESSTGGAGSDGADQGGKESAGSDGAGKDSAGKDGGGQSAGNGSGAGAKGSMCRTDALNITALDSTIGGDDEGSVAVTIDNNSQKDCTLAAYAGVDLKTSQGRLSAKRSGEQASPMVLKVGKSVSFYISYPKNDSGGSGVSVTGLVVTPPNETKSVSLEWPGDATLPVTEDGGTPVKVGPMGSAGQGG